MTNEYAFKKLWPAVLLALMGIAIVALVILTVSDDQSEVKGAGTTAVNGIYM